MTTLSAWLECFLVLKVSFSMDVMWRGQKSQFRFSMAVIGRGQTRQFQHGCKVSWSNMGVSARLECVAVNNVHNVRFSRAEICLVQIYITYMCNFCSAI